MPAQGNAASRYHPHPYPQQLYTQQQYSFQQQQIPEDYRQAGSVPRFSAPTDMSHVFNMSNAYKTQWLWLDLECTGLDPMSPMFGILEIAAAVTDDDLTVVDTLHLVVHQDDAILNAASSWCNAHFGNRMQGGNDLFEQSRASVITEEEAGLQLEAFILKHAQMRRSKQSYAVNNNPASNTKRQFFEAAAFGDVEAAGEDGAPPLIIPPVLKQEPVVQKKQASITSAKAGQQQQHDVYRVMLAGCSVYYDRHVINTRYPGLRKYIAHKVVDATSVLEIVRRWRPDVSNGLQCAQGCHRALPDMLESIQLLKYFYVNLFMRST